MKFDRDTLIEMVAQQNLDNADMDALMDYFYEGQIAYLEGLDDNELLDAADWAGITGDIEDDE
jgi:hypothetical protein